MTSGSVKEVLPVAPASAGLTEGGDLTRAECVAAAIRKAFPLPPSGAFKDLLAAIDGTPRT